MSGDSYVVLNAAHLIHLTLWSIKKMKIVRKIIIWTFSLGLIFFLLFVFAFAIYLETSIDKVMSKKRQEELFSRVGKSELPDNFLLTIQKYYPDRFSQSMWMSIGNQLLGRSRSQCQCRDIYIHPGYTDNWISFTQEIVALELEEKFSQEKCYEFNTSILNFGFGTRSIEEAAKYYYNKELNELSETEILELDLIRIAPSQFNPIYNKEELDKNIDKVIKKEKGKVKEGVTDHNTKK